MTSSFDKYKSKSIDGCRDCPPRKACEGAEITFEGSGCVEGGGEITLRQPHDETIKFHVDCPGNGKLSIKTCESLEGGGDFYANAKCNEDITLCINNEWLHKFVQSRICNGELKVITTDDMKGGGTFTANQCNNTNIVLGVNWEKFPACNKGGLVLQDGCWRVNLRDVIADAPPVDWDDIINKPKCYPACDIEWDDIKNKPDLSGGGGGDSGPEDDGSKYPFLYTRMWGEIQAKNDKSRGEAEIGFCSKTTDGKNCVSVHKAEFVDQNGKQESWMVTLKFAKSLPTAQYIVNATVKKGSYDHTISYVNDKDDGFLDPKDGFTIIIHDVENNTSMPGSDSRQNSNHVCDFSFSVLW